MEWKTLLIDVKEIFMAYGDHLKHMRFHLSYG